MGNKSSLFCRSIEERQFDVLVVVETWHECSESVALKRIVPPGYQSIDAARPIPPDVRTETFQDRGGLAFICRQATVRVHKRLLNITVTTFEYRCGYVSTRVSHFLLLGIYRPGSQAVTSVFLDELSSIFEQLATYSTEALWSSVEISTFKPKTYTLSACRDCCSRSTVGNMSLFTDQIHTGGHTLDLVITRTDTFIRDLCVGDTVSDHAMISFKLEGAPKPTVSVQLVQRRAW